MDEVKGGQTLSLQGREGENRRQSANLGRNGKEKKKLDQPGQGDSEHEKGAGEGRCMTVALAMAWPRRAELWRKQWWWY